MPQVNEKVLNRRHVALQCLAEFERVWVLNPFPRTVCACILFSCLPMARTHSHMSTWWQRASKSLQLGWLVLGTLCAVLSRNLAKAFWLNSIFMDPLVGTSVRLSCSDAGKAAGTSEKGWGIRPPAAGPLRCVVTSSFTLSVTPSWFAHEKIIQEREDPCFVVVHAVWTRLWRAPSNPRSPSRWEKVTPR